MTIDIPIYRRINSMLDSLSKSERKLAEKIVELEGHVTNMTAADLAEQAGVSTATVSRLTQSLGMERFSELKIKISAEIHNEQIVGYSEITTDETLEEVKAKLLGNAYQALEETLQLLPEEQLEEVADTLNAASIIYVYGTGSSWLAAEAIRQKWMNIGKIVQLFQNPKILISGLTPVPKNLALILISNEDEVQELMAMAKIAKTHGIKVITMSRLGDAELSKYSDYELATYRPVFNETMSLAATSTLLSKFMAIDALFYAYVLKYRKRVLKDASIVRSDYESYKNMLN